MFTFVVEIKVILFEKKRILLIPMLFLIIFSAILQKQIHLNTVNIITLFNLLSTFFCGTIFNMKRTLQNIITF